jgi:hypothetical protein
MKPKTMIQLVMMLCVITPLGALAQFSSGSTGTDGALVVTNDLTLNLPTNGIFNFTTITISNGATLRFNRNLLNTPAYLLATGDVLIAGSVNVSGGNRNGAAPGLGGPGGFDGGFGGFQGFPAGDGQGPGGGKNANDMFGAAHAFTANANTNIYGNTLLSPLVGGSGGAAVDPAGERRGGGGGGGAILIASSTKITVNGMIRSSGGNGAGGGSGGAVRVVAPVIDGAGQLLVPQGNSDWTGAWGGGEGRTRIDTIDSFAHRNLTLGGKGTRGSQMFVFPAGDPKLDIINAAGTAIPEGADVPVSVTLPVGASTNQIVRVQARGFTNDIPIRVKITPENAPSATFDGVIQQSSGNPPFADVQVTLPVDTVCHVHAWTR